MSKTALSPKQIVKQFLDEVRSGLFPENVGLYMADKILAHQIQAENPVTVERTPDNYMAHVQEFMHLFGSFELEVTELLAEGDKVYARWIQRGIHANDIDGHKATGLSLIEYTSAVYRIAQGKIVEYWLQTDRKGMESQLISNQSVAI